MAGWSDVRRLVLAVERAIEEHGAPNSFAPAELAPFGAPAPMHLGRIARTPGGSEALAKIGARYEERRIVVGGRR
jgi:hypothetical protein